MYMVQHFPAGLFCLLFKRSHRSGGEPPALRDISLSFASSFREIFRNPGSIVVCHSSRCGSGYALVAEPRSDHRARLTAKARHVYITVEQFFPRVTFNPEQQRKFTKKLRLLERALQVLGDAS